jgi:hypothetical protein
MDATQTQSRLGAVQIGIIILTLVTAAIHLYIGLTLPATLFILNGIGYLILLAGLFLNIPFARDNRNLVRWVMIAFAAVTILAWVAIGDKSWPGGALGYFTKLVEILLIVLLFMDRRQR